MKIQKYPKDLMTPVERQQAIEKGISYDRIPIIPFIGNARLLLCKVNEKEYGKSAMNMAKGELCAYERFGLDRLHVGPNSRGIADALGQQLPESMHKENPLDDYEKLCHMEPITAVSHPEFQRFIQAAEILQDSAGEIVPIEASIGGPFTIASFLRGIEQLLRDCRKYPEQIHRMMRLIVDSQKSVVDVMAQYGLGIAMADPVANPALIGPRFYEKFVYPYTLELTEYVYAKIGKKVSLHMCGATYSIWKYLGHYPLNEISLDNVVDLKKAAGELGEYVPIAGNVDPVQIIMNGTKESIFENVKTCIDLGKNAKQGYHLTTGCDIPDGTKLEKIDWFMEAARVYGKV